MVADRVGGGAVLVAPEGASPRFSHVIADGEGELCALGALRATVGSTLFVGDEASCIAYLTRHPGGWALSAGGSAVEPSASTADVGGAAATKPVDAAAASVADAVAERLFVLRASCTPAHAAACAAAELADTQAWIARMQEALLAGGGYQELADAAEPALGNSLALSDAGFRIIAHTRRLLPPDPLMRDSIEQGRLSREALDSFRRHGRPQRWSTQTGVHVLEGYGGCPIVECIFRVEGVYAAHLVMHCDRRPLTEGLLDKLALLCTCIELNLKKELPASRLFDQGPARVLADLAAGMPVSRRSLEAWFRATGLSRDGRFELAVVDYGYRDDERQLAVNACLRLLDLFPDAVVGLQDNRALVLRSLADCDDSFRAAIGRHALEFGGRAGLSDLLDLVEDLRYAYRQADIALQMSAAEEHSAEGDVAFGDDGRSDDGARDGGACRFRDYFVAYLLTSEHQDNELVSFTVSHSVPARLREADRAAGTQDCALLLSYLALERRPSTVAQRLHLHRNTLLYRVRRMEQEYGIDLDDWRTRERLLAEYQIMRFGG